MAPGELLGVIAQKYYGTCHGGAVDVIFAANRDKLVIVEGAVSYDDFSAGYRITANTIYDMTQAREKFSRCLEISFDRRRLNGSWTDESMATRLSDVLQTYREGQCPVCVEYNSGAEITRMALGDDWRVQPTDELLHRLRALFDEEQVRVVY